MDFLWLGVPVLIGDLISLQGWIADCGLRDLWQDSAALAGIDERGRLGASTFEMIMARLRGIYERGRLGAST